MIKICNKCKKEKPATTEFFHLKRKTSNILRGMCRQCKGNACKEYNAKNIESVRECKRKYEKENRGRYNEASREQFKNDSFVNKKRTTSNAIRAAIRNNKNYKVFDKLSYTVKELRDHLESLFEPWMSWHNQGVYHFDKWDDKDQSTWKWNLVHIENFSYDSTEHPNFIKHWSLDNLKPYSAKKYTRKK